MIFTKSITLFYIFSVLHFTAVNFQRTINLIKLFLIKNLVFT